MTPRTPEIARFENVPTEPGRYVYRVKSTGASSAKFGPCEACGKHVSDVCLQVEGRTFDLDGVLAITYYECRNGMFGHEECLKASRR